MILNTGVVMLKTQLSVNVKLYCFHSFNDINAVLLSRGEFKTLHTLIDHVRNRFGAVVK